MTKRGTDRQRKSPDESPHVSPQGSGIVDGTPIVIKPSDNHRRQSEYIQGFGNFGS